MTLSEYVYIIIGEHDFDYEDPEIYVQEIKATFTVKSEMIDYLKKVEETKFLEIWRTAANIDVKNVTETIMEELQKELESCPNCKEPLNSECACMRNRCIDCGKAVGNITFSKCDKCWM